MKRGANLGSVRMSSYYSVWMLRNELPLFTVTYDTRWRARSIERIEKRASGLRSVQIRAVCREHSTIPDAAAGSEVGPSGL